MSGGKLSCSICDSHFRRYVIAVNMNDKRLALQHLKAYDIHLDEAHPGSLREDF